MSFLSAAHMLGYGSKNLVLVTALLVYSVVLVLADMKYPLTTNWSVGNDPSGTLRQISRYPKDSVFRIIFANSNNSVLLGFHDTLNGFSTLSIVLNPLNITYNNQEIDYPYQVVWSANRNHPVGVNAVLKMSGGNLVLQDNNTQEVWFTNLKGGKSVSGIDVQDSGNVVLYDANNKTVWQSFDHPTDTILLGSNLTHTMTVVASSSATNASEGGFKMVMEAQALVSYVRSKSGQDQPYSIRGPFNVSLLLDAVTPHPSGSLAYAQISTQFGEMSYVFLNIFSKAGFSGYAFRILQSPVFLRLESDGIIQGYSIDPMATPGSYWYTSPQHESICNLPTTCGVYGICSTSPTFQKICTCPSGEDGGIPHFHLYNSSDSTQGCYPTHQWKCDVSNVTMGSRDFSLLEVKSVTYFQNKFMMPLNVTLRECKRRCLENCSYTAAFYRDDISACYLIQDALTIRNNSNVTYASFLKVKADLRKIERNPFGTWKLGIVISSGVFVVIIGIIVVMWKRMSNTSQEAEDEDAFLESLSGLPPRFSYKELEIATKNFTIILGEGGFGTVYAGVIFSNGNKIAVKKLEGTKQGQKEFRAEVATIGSIHHIHLVRLMGFCCERSHRIEHRMLVYEYMVNGSLDKWIFVIYY